MTAKGFKKYNRAKTTEEYKGSMNGYVVLLGTVILCIGAAVGLNSPFEVSVDRGRVLVYPYAVVGGLIMLVGFVCFAIGLAIPSSNHGEDRRRQVEEEILAEVGAERSHRRKKKTRTKEKRED